MNNSYCTHCKRGAISQEEIEAFRRGEDEGFVEWCWGRRIRLGGKGLDWTKATEQDVKEYIDWETAWADAGIPG